MKDYLVTQRIDIPLDGFVVNLVLTAVLSALLGLAYARFGGSLSNRRVFARNFVLLGMTTMLIITIVKSSLALSLGLVGALSIVRFRAAIKEPEELAYLFLVIAIGLGLGADQTVVTLIAFVVILLGLWVRSLRARSDSRRNLHLSITCDGQADASLSRIVEVLRRHCPELDLKRFDETDALLEASFVVELDGSEALQDAAQELRGIHPSVQVRFVDTGLLGA